jgi:hypothetical protein
MLKKTAEISAVLRQMIHAVSFKILHKNKPTFFTRKAKLTFTRMIAIMINKSTKSSRNALNDAMTEITALHPEENLTVTNSAYTQARAKLSYTAFEALSDTTVRLFYEDGEYETCKGYRILAIDGSNTILPNTEDVKSVFEATVAKNQVEGFVKEVVQARISVLYDVINRMAIDASINDKSKGERVPALEHLRYTDKNDLVLFGRGYPSYELFACYAAQTNFVMRIRKNSFARAKFLFAAHSEHQDVILQIKAPKMLREQLRKADLPTTMKVRFVRVVLDNGTVEVLATNVPENSRLHTGDFKELYAARWGIETYFDLLKNRLSLENFTGLSALAVKQDFYATIFLSNYESVLVYDANLELREKGKKNRYAQQVNKAVSFNTIKRRVFDLFYSDKDLETMMEQIKVLLFTNTVAIRPGRKTKPRLDKMKDKSTIASNTINHIKRKKKNVGD